MKAGTYLKDPNCHFVATCCDETYPEKSKDNLVFPGKNFSKGYIDQRDSI